MTIQNSDIAQQFEEIADFLELENANPFRVRAYRTAAHSLRDYPHEVGDMIQRNEDLDSIPGIGKDLAKKINEAVKTGKMRYLEHLKHKTPEALIELLQIPGLGPKRVQLLHKKLHIKTLKDLKTAIREHKVRSLPGLGEKTEDLIREGISHREVAATRHRLADIVRYAEQLRHYVSLLEDVTAVEICGSYRRRVETVGDLDIVIAARRGSRPLEEFLQYQDITDVIAKGETRASVVMKQKFQVDIRAVPAKSYGAALHYFTGSKSHVITLRQRALDRGLKINEYGVFKNGTALAGKTEESVYKALGLSYIVPELRENRGEIQAAEKHQLPQLIELKDLKGDLHTHTKSTDGRNTLREMAEAAKAFGLEYIANTDHSQRMTMSHGFNEKDVLKRCEEIDKLNEELSGITILKGIEVDILEDGRLDLSDTILGQLDVVIASIHSHFKLSRSKQTERLIRAIENTHVTMIGHLTGRLIGEREGYALDIEKVLQRVQKRGSFLELDSDPSRLDINDIVCRMAKDMGILVSINSDAHSINHYAHLTYGIGQARRGWLEKDDVLNTRPIKDLAQLLKAASKK